MLDKIGAGVAVGSGANTVVGSVLAAADELAADGVVEVPTVGPQRPLLSAEVTDTPPPSSVRGVATI